MSWEPGRIEGSQVDWYHQIISNKAKRSGIDIKNLFTRVVKGGVTPPNSVEVSERRIAVGQRQSRLTIDFKDLLKLGFEEKEIRKLQTLAAPRATKQIAIKLFKEELQTAILSGNIDAFHKLYGEARQHRLPIVHEEIEAMCHKIPDANRKRAMKKAVKLQEFASIALFEILQVGKIEGLERLASLCGSEKVDFGHCLKIALSEVKPGSKKHPMVLEAYRGLMADGLNKYDSAVKKGDRQACDEAEAEVQETLLELVRGGVEIPLVETIVRWAIKIYNENPLTEHKWDIESHARSIWIEALHRGLASNSKIRDVKLLTSVARGVNAHEVFGLASKLAGFIRERKISDMRMLIVKLIADDKRDMATVESLIRLACKEGGFDPVEYAPLFLFEAIRNEFGTLILSNDLEKLERRLTEFTRFGYDVFPAFNDATTDIRERALVEAAVLNKAQAAYAAFVSRGKSS
jgi:hypothetical protein